MPDQICFHFTCLFFLVLFFETPTFSSFSSNICLTCLHVSFLPRFPVGKTILCVCVPFKIRDLTGLQISCLTPSAPRHNVYLCFARVVCWGG